MNTLFKSGVTADRTQTQLAYRIRYWPYNQLSKAARDLIRSFKLFYLRKDQLLARCNAERNRLTFNGVDYQIVWEYNNMPTEKEWNGKTDSFLVHVELRGSPVIEGYYAALLSFKLPSSTLSAHSRGEMTDAY